MAAEIIGNRSVHWRVRHFTKAGGGRPIRHVTGATPGNDEVVTGNGFADGKDAIDFNDIGVRHGRPGFFEVRLRFASREAALEALQAQIQELPAPAGPGAPGAGSVIVTVLVPAIGRNNPNQNPPAEIVVDW